MQELTEGVIQFHAEHKQTPLPKAYRDQPCRELTAWRSVFVRLRLMGQDPVRYDGYGFGNLSMRVGPFPGQKNRRPFLITGTQTGKVSRMRAEHYCLVREYDVERNWVRSEGDVNPSSEAMTHGSVYNLDPRVRAVVHVHSPQLFLHHDRGMRVTDADVGYGTPEMANEVSRLFRNASKDKGCFVMAGHEDGVVSFGRSLEEASTLMIRALASSFKTG